ncbi:MAG: tetratricopeptide repeat protein [Candidatus Margulisbacteria bacterium]|nr:tetratricopeptide repeat protein [Candidatus Margulisiibacteriota bacterium]MBU1021679.1 tetratricopeptide repeat protein [Candidatus Margulisiibacteriota bacterium]MBU1729557.1 tetratricopeptide repeat protein [Candidatus Margulisiibacteriota bacterium]MBU1955043.1 tetratricopeptide repeat protein [Candidatus Margulisiibacteriota bacterium]
MKKVILAGIVLILVMSFASMLQAYDMEVVKSGNVSILAGPTRANEDLALVWLETIVSPRVVENQGNLALFARMTSQVSAVSVSFDFDGKEIPLTSTDGISWNTFYALPPGVAEGVHVASFKIMQGDRFVERSLDFFVNQDLASEVDVQENTVLMEKEKGWPVTINASQAYLANAAGEVTGFKSFKNVIKNEPVTGLYKAPWYRVRFADGTEGWVIASQVEEPTYSFYEKGYSYYAKKDYQTAAYFYSKALVVDPAYYKARYWLAKSYYKMGKQYLAVRELVDLLRRDPGNYNAGILSTILAQEQFAKAHQHFINGEYQQAVIAYEGVIDLKPSFVTAQIEMGDCYKKMGFDVLAKETWMAALTNDPENNSAKIRLDMDETQIAETMLQKEEAAKVEPKIAAPSQAAEKPKAEEKSVALSESISIVKTARTDKGTAIQKAITDVIELTKSYGTLVRVRGWKVEPQGRDLFVTFTCEQDRSGSGASYSTEQFSWKVDQATQKINPHNVNARLLMSSW